MNLKIICHLTGTCWRYWLESVQTIENILKNFYEIIFLFLTYSKCFNDFQTVFIYRYELNLMIFLSSSHCNDKTWIFCDCFHGWLIKLSQQGTNIFHNISVIEKIVVKWEWTELYVKFTLLDAMFALECNHNLLRIDTNKNCLQIYTWVKISHRMTINISCSLSN